MKAILLIETILTRRSGVEPTLEAHSVDSAMIVVARQGAQDFKERYDMPAFSLKSVLSVHHQSARWRLPMGRLQGPVQNTGSILLVTRTRSVPAGSRTASGGRIC